MRAIALGLVFSFGLAACGPVDANDDDLVTEPVVLPARADIESDAAKADGIRTYVIRSVTVPARLATTETRKVFTTAASFKSYFGQGASVPVDFSKRWLAFYSAGNKPTGGFSVSIPLINVSSTGRTLELNTRLVSPGEGCIVTQATTKPTVLVSFAKPNPAPGAVRYYKSDVKPAACVTTAPATLCGAELRTALTNATTGMLWSSESDYPFEWFERAGAGSVALTPARLLTLLNLPASTIIAERSLADGMAWVTGDAYVTDGGWSPEQLAKNRALKALLEANLTDVKMWKVGTIEVGTYFIGKTRCGDIAGLATISIET